METIYIATNRDPKGRPASTFGTSFNRAHPHELRFGEIAVDASGGSPDESGTNLSDRLTQRVENSEAQLQIYPERLSGANPQFGSTTMFEQLHEKMQCGEDAVVYIHGYATTFARAVGNAVALQHKLRGENVSANVILFTWPSDGRKLQYKSDRDDAAASGIAFARGFQRLHAFLRSMNRDERCERNIHLLCHSMGNFVLENTLWHLRMNVQRLPRIFTEILMAAADVDADALEHDRKLARLPDITRRTTVYYNRGDWALQLSDATKGNPNRLGEAGPARPLDVPTGVVNVDCSEVVGGLVEHAYYLDEVLQDVALTLRGIQENTFPQRNYVASANAYRLAGA